MVETGNSAARLLVWRFHVHNLALVGMRLRRWFAGVPTGPLRDSEEAAKAHYEWAMERANERFRPAADQRRGRRTKKARVSSAGLLVPSHDQFTDQGIR
jgi:hypothetical protein